MKWFKENKFLAGLLVFLARTAIVSQVTDSLVKTDSVRPAATAISCSIS